MGRARPRARPRLRAVAVCAAEVEGSGCVRGGLGIRAVCAAVLAVECILIWKNVLPGITFRLENHPDSEECSLRDYFQRQKSS